MKKNIIHNIWTSVLFILFVWMPIKGIAQTNELVVEKRDGTELTFKITGDYPVVQYYWGDGNGIKSIEIQAVEGNQILPCAEIKCLFTRVEKKGDVNGDGNINVADIEEIIINILGFPSDKFKFEEADVNGDGFVNIADIVMILNLINDN